MKSAFARHGGPPFNSDGFSNFLQGWNIIHNKTYLYFHQSNDLFGRAIQTFKCGMRKAMEEGKDLHTVLLDYRVTPSKGLKSPAELLMGRRLRSFNLILTYIRRKSNLKRTRDDKRNMLTETRRLCHTYIFSNRCCSA
ncbi:hypothetical protein JTE90_018215 [Oedothorax gibbosus]|uniref:Uncharacterized protein n=1 Tax=Oedothorax gibbosus TaxID=931172 RepID=A0AAV6U7Q4_9ARAC|nr:hypothetical protein JTE90_018215 [Oedothorax gibbosus]